jgi:hypothetical protein
MRILYIVSKVSWVNRDSRGHSDGSRARTSYIEVREAQA